MTRDQRGRVARSFGGVVVALCLLLLVTESDQAHAKTPKWVKHAGTVLSAPVKVAVAAATGESVPDAVKEGTEATEDLATDIATAASLVGRAGPKISPPQPQPGPTAPIGSSSMNPQMVVAVGLLVWAMTDPDSFCDFWSAGQDPQCGIDAGVAVNSDGEVSTPGNEPYHAPTEKETQAAYDYDLLDYMQKQFATDWEREMWSERYVERGVGVLRPQSGPMQGVTWFAEKPGKVTETGELREAVGGNPRFGARRYRDDGNYGLHLGTDLKAQPGDKVLAAFDGTVRYEANVHKGMFGMVVVTSNSGHRQESLYVLPINEVKYDGSWAVRRGDAIAVADDLHRHPDYATTPNHVHNAYKSPEGIYIGPENNFGIARETQEIANMCGTSACIMFHNDDKPQIPPPAKRGPR